MKTPKKFLTLALAIFSIQFLSATCARATSWAWTGTGGNGNWSDSGNWGSLGTPTNGDTVIFPAGSPRLFNTNDIANLTLAQIRFFGASGGYNIFGNAITLTNSIEATNTAGGNTLNFSITNSAAGSPTNITINVGAGASLINNGGNIYGTADITKTGAGSLVYQASGNNPYTGTTRINAGTLFLNVSGLIAFGGPLVIGDGSGLGSPAVRHLQSTEIGDTLPITINQGGLLDLNNFVETISPSLTLNDSASIATGTGTLTLSPNATVTVTANAFSPGINGNVSASGTNSFSIVNGAFFMNASLGGTAAINKEGPGTMYLTVSNSYSGLTVLKTGILAIQNSWSLGLTNNGTVVSNGASLFVLLNGNIFNESLSLNGPGPGFGSLEAEGQTNTWAGPITLNANSTIDAYSAGVGLRITGPISGPGGLTVFSLSGGGTVFFEGSAANTYVGTTHVNANTTLLLNKFISNGAIPGNLDISGTVRLLNLQQIADTADVQVQGGGLLDFGSVYETFDTLHGNGSVTFGNFGYLDIGANNGTSTFDGLMSGTGYPGGYTVLKLGNGTFTLTANNTYLNATMISSGKLVINGNQPQSPVWLNGGTLAGSGTVGSIVTFSPSSVSPGSSPGILTSAGTVTLAPGDTYSVDITGPAPGTGYDQLNSSGSNYLGGASLGLNSTPTAPLAVGDVMYIIQANNVGGTFAGSPNNTTYTFGGFSYRLNYAPTAVTLTVTDVPGAVSGSSISAGNGNHLIDPNECNDLFIVISNKNGSPITGVSASLVADSPHVFVTQPNSAYPNVPGNGTATNLTAFQISTLPGFVCASDINLTLTVNGSTPFKVPVVLHTGTPAAPARFDNNTFTAIPDPGAVDSTNIVSGLASSLQKVTVALYITHNSDADLTNISLIGPDGTTVMLSAGNGGSGDNYGSDCADGSRTTFDDSAATSITAGVAPFVGTFRPQQSLSAFIGKSGVDVNGPWRLRIADGFGGTSGTLRCWSLFVSDTDCTGGGGFCDTCPGVITNTISDGDLVAPDRLSRTFGVPSTCAQPKNCVGGGNEPARYDAYNFTNNGPATCVNVYIDNPCGLFTAAYLGSYDPTNLCQNYLGDLSANLQFGSFSVSVPANTNFVVVVNEIPFETGGCDYTLIVTGTDCQPRLNINPVPNNQVRLTWPTSAGGYLLEATPSLSPTNWAGVTNQPIVGGLKYNVTNNVSGTNRFYRLHKP